MAAASGSESGLELAELRSSPDDAAVAEALGTASASVAPGVSMSTFSRRRARTFYRLPRVRKASIKEKDTVGVTAEETFWNIIFSAAFGPSAVGHFFINNDYMFGSIHLLCFYSTFATSAVYAARFNDSDILHKGLWVIHGLLLAGMLSRTGDVDTRRMNTRKAMVTFHWFCNYCAATKLLIALMYARAAFHLPVRRRACLMHFVFLGTQALMLLSVSLWLNRHNAFDHSWILLPLLALEVGNMPSFLSAKLRCRGRRFVTPIPISIEYQTARSSSLVVMLLGLMIVHIVTKCREWSDVSLDCWSQPVSYIIFAVFMNILFYQASQVDFELHALRNTLATAWLWFFAQLGFVVATTVTSSGFNDNLKECDDNDEIPSEFARQKVCVGAMAMFFVICLLDFIHDTPCRMCRRRQLDRGRGDRCCGYMSRPRQARIVSHLLGIITAAVALYAPEYMMGPILATTTLLLVVVFGLAKRLRQRKRDRGSIFEIDAFHMSSLPGMINGSIMEVEGNFAQEHSQSCQTSDLDLLVH